jgi:hypothetical protein
MTARTGTRLLAALAALAGLTTGCHPAAAPAGAPAQAARLVPWTGSVPPLLRPRPVRPAAPCRAAQLRVDGGGLLFQPAAHGGTGTLRLRNAGRLPCRLDGRPQVRFVGAPAGPAQRQLALPAEPPAFPALLPPPGVLLALPPGAGATLTVDWRNWCVPGPRAVPPRVVRVSLPRGAGSLDADYSAVTSCEDRTQPSTVGVRPFQPAALAEPGGWTNLRVRATVGALGGQPAPPHGRRGQTVAFAVELRNASSTGTVRFDRCPVLAELLAPAGGTEAYELNCAAAAPIPPGGALRFEMRLRVPVAAPLGPNGLFWALDATGSQPLEVISRVVVDG